MLVPVSSEYCVLQGIEADVRATREMIEQLRSADQVSRGFFKLLKSTSIAAVMFDVNVS